MRTILLALVAAILIAGSGGNCATAIPSGAGRDEAKALAVSDLQKRLDIPREQITVVAVEAVEWPDTSLGRPEPGMSYATVIVPGFSISLSARGQSYVYHAGLLGGGMTVIRASP